MVLRPGEKRPELTTKFPEVVKLGEEAAKISERLGVVLEELAGLGCIVQPPAWDVLLNWDHSGRLVSVRQIRQLGIRYLPDSDDNYLLENGAAYTTKPAEDAETPGD